MRVLLKITDIIDVEVLQRIQDSFSDATGLAAVTVDYKGNPITEYSNFSEYCTASEKKVAIGIVAFSQMPTAGLSQPDLGNHRFTFVMGDWSTLPFRSWSKVIILALLWPAR
jgi:Predicted sensor domain